MIEQELILLGLLKENPKHGYEIKKRIKEILGLFAGIDLKSIYYPLSILEKKGFVLKKQDKSGNRPTKFVYELTSKGNIRLEQLLNKGFLDFRRPQFTLDLSLYFLHLVKPVIAKRRLKARVYILKKIVKDLLHMDRTFEKNKQTPLRNINQHNLQMVEAEISFLEDLIKKI